MAQSQPLFAWQPLTPRGIAAFACATIGRLWLVQLAAGMLVAGVIVWFTHRDWYPVITDAIAELPDEGQLRNGGLEWNGDESIVLAESPFLSIAVDLEHSGDARTPADLQVEFGERDLKLFSILGFSRINYSRSSNLGFNHTDLEPWWGAWNPVLLAITALCTIATLLVTWAVLATIYFLPVWLGAFYGDRELRLAGSWRLSGAALMPAALFFTVGIILYGLGIINLVSLGMAFALHFIIGWIYLVLGARTLPRHPENSGKNNPFTENEKKN
jgi:hypothetical protein